MRKNLPERAFDVLVPFAAGIYFALVQTSYFLLHEAHLSSQSLSYFVALFFWLTGLLLGLRFRAGSWIGPLLGAGVAAYYLTFGMTRWIPFHAALYPGAAACAVISGVLPGFFFRFAARRWSPVSRPLFHENNGFVLGLFLSLRGATHFGGKLVSFGPAAGAAIFLIVLAADRAVTRSPGRAGSPR